MHQVSRMYLGIRIIVCHNLQQLLLGDILW